MQTDFSSVKASTQRGPNEVAGYITMKAGLVIRS